MKIKQGFNLLGWHTNRKIVVIESDGWGSIRMPSKEVYDYLLRKGYRVNERYYERFDSLGNNDDLEALFETLMSVKDKNGNPAKVTANSVVANPNFEKIKKNDFRTYYYELFLGTFHKYNNHSRSYELWLEGLHKGLFIPQFHGREHINIPMWMRALQNNDKEARFAFELGMVGIFPKENPQQGNQYMVAYAIDSLDDLTYHQKSIEEGLDIFEKIWGFKSKSFIAPCYTWSKEMESTLKNKKIELIQGTTFQSEPCTSYQNKKIFHYSGEKSSSGLRYNIRNCVFEPTSKPNIDWTDACLKQIQTAFEWHKPAVIASHRVNYIGNIDKSNRHENLKSFKKLLDEIKKNWPDVEFTSSDKLTELLVV